VRGCEWQREREGYDNENEDQHQHQDQDEDEPIWKDEIEKTAENCH
jgi:hypothetical protein